MKKKKKDFKRRLYQCNSSQCEHCIYELICHEENIEEYKEMREAMGYDF